MVNKSIPDIRLTLNIALALLLAFHAVPAEARNYSLHSPKVWTQEEKELFDKENEPADKDQETVKKDLEPIRLPVHKVKTRKIPLKKEKVPVKHDQIQVENGVSYREVIVQKGDTIFGLALKYRHEGATYSEVVRCNDITDPDRVSVGDIIKIPLTNDRAAKQSKPPAAPVPHQPPAKPATPPSDEPSLSDVTIPDPPKDELPSAEDLVKPSRPVDTSFIPPPTLPPPPDPAPVATPVATPVAVKTAAQRLESFSNISSPRNNLFEQAVRSYRRNDCQTALQLFGRFLVENKNSQLAADVSVFIADCYLKLSGK